MKYITNLDLNKNELRNAVIQPLATPPSSPKAGQIYYNSSDGFIYRYNGTVWGAVGVVYSQGSTTGAVITGLDTTGTVITTDVIDLTLTGLTPVSGGVVTGNMSLEAAITALETVIKTKANSTDVPVATTTTPKMDGTASVGTENKWAKGDHIHPTDTSRQETLVSGSNIKTVNNTSLLGSGNLSVGTLTGATINGTSIVDGTVAKIVYETGLGSDSNNAATVTAIRNFVNSSIESVAAYYITSDAQGDAFETKAALDAGSYYYAGTVRTPTRNDYAIVIADETHGGQTARYTYTDNQWAFQYTFNMGFTQAQINAINSGITAAKVALYDAHIASTSNPHSVTKQQVGLGDVGNFKAVSTVASQGLTDAEKSNARTNIGAGTSSFSGDYDDLADKPSITLNGTVTKSPSFYAPTNAGTAGQVLTSNGSEAPTWQTFQSAIKKYTANNTSLTSNGGAWTWNITGTTHGITNSAMIVNIYEVATGAQVVADVTINQTNYNITVTIVDSASIGTLTANTYKVVVIG